MAVIGSLENQKLMPQGKNLGLQRYAGSKSLTNRRKQQENGREHGLSKLSWQRFKFNWVNENRVFGRDNSHMAPTETVLSTVDLVFGLESTNIRHRSGPSQDGRLFQFRDIWAGCPLRSPNAAKES